LALANASGQYVALLDDDDLWIENKLHLQVSVMNHFPELEYAFSDFFILKEHGRKIPKGLSTWFKKPPKWDDIFRKKYGYSEIISEPDLKVKDFNFYIGDLYFSLLQNTYVLPSTAIIRKS
jgi:glycosyltransferase involved in cell wall biosynthesis